MGDVDEQELSQYCGVGVVISPDQIEEQVHVHLRVLFVDVRTCT